MITNLRGHLAILILLPLAWSCGASQDQSGPPQVNVSPPTTAVPFLKATGDNVLSVSVGGSSVCGRSGYPNVMCTTVKVCMPGTSQCQSISDVLVDTGSVGLRIFSSALNLQLPQRTDSSGSDLAECAQFGIGSDWGPLATADVALGNEAAVNTPIQIINKNFAPPPQECSDADTDPDSAGYNGILGVGVFNEDCGSICASSDKTHVFFSCKTAPGASSPSCSPIALPNSQQPQNPVSLLPKDNNGVLIALNPLGLGGASSISGSLILGVGTEPNNNPTGLTGYPLDGQGNFTTQFQGQTYSGSFIDSGTNALLFPNVPNITECSDSGVANGFYCPSSAQGFTATNISATGNAQTSVSFAVGNAESLLNLPDQAYVELAGPSPESFAWGLPFFYGRAVFEVIEGKSSPLGSGPAVSY